MQGYKGKEEEIQDTMSKPFQSPSPVIYPCVLCVVGGILECEPSGCLCPLSTLLFVLFTWL